MPACRRTDPLAVLCGRACYLQTCVVSRLASATAASRPRWYGSFGAVLDSFASGSVLHRRVPHGLARNAQHTVLVGALLPPLYPFPVFRRRPTRSGCSRPGSAWLSAGSRCPPTASRSNFGWKLHGDDSDPSRGMHFMAGGVGWPHGGDPSPGYALGGTAPTKWLFDRDSGFLCLHGQVTRCTFLLHYTQINVATPR